MIRIDGSIGEGGGQILRSSLSLALVTGRAFELRRIRAGRARPGLLRQHLTAVRAAAEIGGAEVEGAELGSQELVFRPGTVRPGEYKFAVGTAGSATLVLQTVLPPLMLAGAPSALTLEGGTHNQAAPPFDFLANTFLPLLERMGPRVEVKLQRWGFYPAGGGSFTAVVNPVASLTPLHLGPARGEVTSRKIRAVVVNLPGHIAKREFETTAELLGWGPETYEWVNERTSPGPGNVCMVQIGSPEVVETFTAFGEKSKTAEEVGQEAASLALEYLNSAAVCGEHLCDQLLLPMALAASGSFTATKWSEHSRTNVEVIREFLPGVLFDVHVFGDGVRIEVRS